MTDPDMSQGPDKTADIAWLRNLAEEGARTPMRGAAILLAAGLIFGLASVVHWTVASGLLDLPSTTFNLLWLGATGVFLVVVTVANLMLSRASGVTTTANRAIGAVWTGVGTGIFALFTSLAIIGIRLEAGVAPAMLTLIPPAIMVFYGIGWAVSAAMQKSRWLGWLAAASFVAAPLLALLAGQSVQYLGYAGCLFGLMAVPGFLLMRSARA
jgi:hypothetical protein